MKRVLTLVVKSDAALLSKITRLASQTIEKAGGKIGPETILSKDDAIALPFESAESQLTDSLNLSFDELPVDWCIRNQDSTIPKLFLADMDSTMIGQECIDEIADYAGIKAEISAITEAAMRGEIQFEDALTNRVRLLKGLKDSVLEQCYLEKIRPNTGAKTLIQTLKRYETRTVLVSGGFTFFTGRIASRLGFDRHVANRLSITQGLLNGELIPPLCGPNSKAQILAEEQMAHQLSIADICAIGDGANDIPMIKAAGLGIAYHAKPALKNIAHAQINHTDLTTVLYFLGIARSDFVKS